MHELTLCQNAIEVIEDYAKEHHAQKVTAVWLEIGAFSCVEPSAIEFCFGLVCRGTLAEGCQLHIKQNQQKTWCKQCKKFILLVSPKQLFCPTCRGQELIIDDNEDIIIKRIAIE